MSVINSKIGIIGGGVSGLAAAKHLSKHNPMVFEATDSIGGVWKHCSFRTTKLQTPRSGYQFSDFPWPPSNNNDDNPSSFPTYVEILDYLDSYANHFDLIKFINFNSKVTEIRFVGDQETMAYQSIMTGRPLWEVAVHNAKSNIIQWYAFEFMVVCSGKYGDIPIMPKFAINQGPQVFKGKVMHTQHYCKLSAQETVQLVKGKKVVVVGYKKSAIDLAIECVEANRGEEVKPCTMVRKAASKIIESYLLYKLPLVKYGLKPDHPFEEDYVSCQVAVLPDKFFHEADEGNINFKRSSNWWFWEGGVEFDDSTKLDADVVLLATGYDGKMKLKDMLPEPFRDFLEVPSGILPLYRGTIHPLIPNMAFIGYLESGTNIHISEIRLKWLARMIDGKFALPSIKKMLDHITKEMDIMKKSSRFYMRNCINTFSINYINEIYEEMGIRQ